MEITNIHCSAKTHHVLFLNVTWKQALSSSLTRVSHSFIVNSVKISPRGMRSMQSLFKLRIYCKIGSEWVSEDSTAPSEPWVWQVNEYQLINSTDNWGSSTPSSTSVLPLCSAVATALPSFHACICGYYLLPVLLCWNSIWRWQVLNKYLGFFLVYYFILLYFILSCVWVLCLHACLGTTYMFGAPGSQKKVPDPLELKPLMRSLVGASCWTQVPWKRTCWKSKKVFPEEFEDLTERTSQHWLHWEEGKTSSREEHSTAVHSGAHL